MRNIFFHIIIISAVILAACSKNEVSLKATHIRFANLTPDKSFDIYSNGDVLKSDLQYDSMTSYATGIPTLYNLNVNLHNTDSVLISGNQRLQSDYYYSVFFIPDTLATSASGVKYAMVTDSRVASRIDTARVRFLDFSPDAPTTTLLFTTNYNNVRVDTLYNMFTNRYYNDQSVVTTAASYKWIPKGFKQVHFVNADITERNYYIDSMPCNFEAGKSYTIYIRGFLNGSGNKKIQSYIMEDD